jgi:hypothetical protein
MDVQRSGTLLYGSSGWLDVQRIGNPLEAIAIH